MPPRLADTALRCLPPAGEREARTLQNLLPFSTWQGVWEKSFEVEVPFLAGGLDEADDGSATWGLSPLKGNYFPDGLIKEDLTQLLCLLQHIVQWKEISWAEDESIYHFHPLLICDLTQIFENMASCLLSTVSSISLSDKKSG